MNQNNNSMALQYGMEACDTMMQKFDAPLLPPVGRFHYHQGVFLSGMYKIYEICGESKYFTYIKDWVDSMLASDGSITGSFDKGQLDDIQPGVLLFPLYSKTGEEKYKKALDRLLPLILHFPRNREGGLWHKVQNKEQMWLDGLYMAGPISAAYGALTNNKEYFDLCITQALLMEEKTRDKRTGLWYHAWDSLRERPWADPVSGRSPEFWGRALGWVPVALLEELDAIPKEYERRDVLIRIVKELIDAVIKYQDESGLWYQVIDKAKEAGNFLESSCTCLFSAAIYKGVRLGYLDEKYLENADKGYDGIIRRLYRENGNLMIDNICVGTGVGDYRHYCNRPTSVNDLHGVGAYLHMCAEAALAEEQRRK